MSVSYFVRYEGTAENPAEFLRCYREHHAPILARFPRGFAALFCIRRSNGRTVSPYIRIVSRSWRR
jgi:hypothetical protein